MSRRTARSAALLVAIAAFLPLSGCAAPEATAAQVCFDWPHYESPSAAGEQADAVAVGRILDRAGTTTYYELTASTWNVSVDEWISGGDDDAEIVVTSLPRGCGDTDDTMADAASGTPLVLFLHRGDDGWETITPLQGIVEPGPDGGLPEKWPDDQED